MSRLGNTCCVNGKDVYDSFNADLKTFKPTAGTITADFSQILNASKLHISSYKLNVSGVVLTFYVEGASRDECFINTSNLIAECKSCVLTTGGDAFEYVAVLTSYKMEETGVDFFNELELTFGVIKRLPTVMHEFPPGTQSMSFNNIGNVTSGAKIIVTPVIDLGELRVNDITIRNLVANYPFIIDGIAGEVKCNGINRFLDTDMIEFPKVFQGENTILLSNPSAKIEVYFNPTFII